MTYSFSTQDELPFNDFFEYYGPDYRLHITPSNMENMNSRKYLDSTTVRGRFVAVWSLCACCLSTLFSPQTLLYQLLKDIEPAPSVQIQTGATDHTPPPFVTTSSRRAEEGDPDVRDNGTFPGLAMCYVCVFALKMNQLTTVIMCQSMLVTLGWKLIPSDTARRVM